MNAPRQRGAPAQTSPRQAILVDAGELRPPTGNPLGAPSERLVDPWPDELRRAVLLDLLGSLVGVNGATISVLAAGAAHAHAIAALIPPGIDLIHPPPDADTSGGRFVWAIAHHLQRAFTRVVAVAVDLPTLPTRTVATALSTLAATDLIVGPTPGQGLYLIGVRDQLGLDVVTAAGAASSFDSLTLGAGTTAARSRNAVLRAVERRPRLGDADRLDPIRDAVAAAPAASPRTAALLRTMTGSRHAGPGIPTGIGGIDFARSAGR